LGGKSPGTSPGEKAQFPGTRAENWRDAPTAGIEKEGPELERFLSTEVRRQLGDHLRGGRSWEMLTTKQAPERISKSRRE